MLSHDFYLRAYITREKFQVLRKSCNSYPKLIFSGLVLSPRKRRGHIEQQQPHLEVRRVPVPRTLARHRTSAEHSREVATPPKAFDSGLSFQNSGRFSQSFQPTIGHLRRHSVDRFELWRNDPRFVSLHDQVHARHHPRDGHGTDS